jgi:hypothetical protein
LGHKVYISFKTEDFAYKEEIQSWEHIDYVDKSLNEPINSSDQDYILRKIREDYLNESTVTIFLIGAFSAESLGKDEQYYIKKELQGSLFNGAGNSRSGILGVVLPSMISQVFGENDICPVCGEAHRVVHVGDATTIREFGQNFFIPHGGCSWTDEQRYCVLVSWADFRLSPTSWIDEAFNKRALPIAQKVRVRP